MECALCHKKERSKTRCIKGHFICNQCHTKGIDQVLTLCLETTSANPVEILDHLMAQPFCHMHGPEHHILVGASLLTAYRNAGGEIDLAPALVELQRRGSTSPAASAVSGGPAVLESAQECLSPFSQTPPRSAKSPSAFPTR